MKRLIILGAGASKSYDKSKTGVKMPVAIDFFETFRQLDISENPWVLIGNIINYIADRNKKNVLDFLNFSEDIEFLHSEIQEKLYKILKRDNLFSEDYDIIIFKAYTELIYLFISVINEIQNGEISQPHLNLAKQLTKNDTIISFNWDTLMDRALKSETKWNTENGYFVNPTSIYKDKWINQFENSRNIDFPLLLKLHGSSNWLTSHIQISTSGKLELSHETKIENFYVFENSIRPYATFAGRYMSGYEEFSFGYYPPNLPLKGKEPPKGHVFVKNRIKNQNIPEGNSKENGLTSMPLIIPPVKNKEYDLFGTLFTQIWNKAEEEIELADEIHVIGYSFPKTDVRTDLLFKNAFIKRKTIPLIVILNPNPELILERFIYDYGIPKSNIIVKKCYFDNSFEL